MLRLIVWRLAQLPLILAVIFIVTFALAWLVPGNPLERSEKRPPKEVQEAMLRQYNLQSPWAFAGGYVQGLFLGSREHRENYDTTGPFAFAKSYLRLLWTGSKGYRPPYFGPSLQQADQTVNDIISEGLPYSASLGLLAIVLALGLGLSAGVVGAVRPGSPAELGSLSVALVGISLPTFVTGSVLLGVFAGLLHWAPIGSWNWPDWPMGWSSPRHWAVFTGAWWTGGENDNGFLTMLQKMILPALTLSLAPAAYIARLIRLGLAEVMHSDFIRTARAKGLSPRTVLFKHALKIAFLPVVSFLGPAAAYAMTGSFVVEKVFSINGLGTYFVDAVTNKDQFLILGLVLTYSTMLIVFNLIVDVAYVWVDPRIEV
jgi:oligopeptide transport system permease protein